MASKKPETAKKSASNAKPASLAVPLLAQTDRVNTVPPSGTITINGKRPIVLLFINSNIVPVPVHMKIANYYSGLHIFQDIIINPLSSMSYNIDIDLGPGSSKSLLYYHIELTNLSQYPYEVSYSDFNIFI